VESDAGDADDNAGDGPGKAAPSGTGDADD
jgi:hypothetical protein